MNKITDQPDRWMKIISTRPCLHLRANLGPRIAFWGLIWVIFWSLFWVPFLGAVLGPWILFVIVGAQTVPQNGTQNKDQNLTQIRTPKWNPGTPNLYGGAIKDVYRWFFIQRSAGRSDSIVQQTNNFNQRRKGNLGGQNCSKSEHEYIHRPHISQDMFYLQKIQSQVSRMGKSTACLLQYIYICIYIFEINDILLRWIKQQSILD